MSYSRAGVQPIIPSSKELVVSRFLMPHICLDRQEDRSLLEIFGCSTAAHTSAVFETCIFGDNRLSSRRAAWKDFSNALGKAFNVFSVHLRAAFCLAFFSPLPDFAVCQTVLFSLAQSLFLNEQSLSLVAISRAAPLKQNRRQG